jgi:hypothetical protein
MVAPRLNRPLFSTLLGPVAMAALCGTLNPGAARAQDDEPDVSSVRQRDFAFGPSLHYGLPLKLSVPLNFTFTVPQAEGTEGVFVAIEPGLGGFQESIGYLVRGVDPVLRGAVRLSVLHPRKRAWRAPAGSHFVGVQVQWLRTIVNARAGAFLKAAGSSSRRGLFTLDVGLGL